MDCDYEYYDFGRDGNNVHYKGKYCYTEDRILIHNLYISNIPKNVNETELNTHFSKFGDVLSVTIRKKSHARNRDSFRYGFVNFKDAESAANALKAQPHVLGVNKITVKAADSWKQPEMTKQNSSTKSSSSSSSSTTTTDQTANNSKENDENSDANQLIEENCIMRLNDDCLLHIFSFLSLNDQLKLSLICDRFQSIFEMIFRKKKTLNMTANGNLTLMEVRQIIKQVGHHIQEAHLEGFGEQTPTNHSRCLEFMSHSCTNLRWLELSSVSNIHSEIYRRISMSFKNLTKVELKNCSITDQICLHLSHLPLLESLDISENYELTGKYLSKFPQLQRLNLSQCANIQSKHFSELCKMKRLKSLNIKRCDRLTKKNFSEMETILNDLEDLVISSSYQTDDLYHIAGLKSLKELTIYCSQNLPDNLFENLSKYKGNNLETLVLIASNLNNHKIACICSMKGIKKLGILRDPSMDDNFLKQIAELPNLTSLNLAGCVQMTRTGIAILFEKSHSLKNIDISCCDQIYPETIYDIVETIKKTNRSTPCTLYIGNTNIQNNILQDAKYLECASLLPLSFQICEFGVSFELVDEDDEYLSDDDYFDDIYEYYDSGDDDDDDIDFDDDLQYDPHFVYGEDFPLFWF